MSEGVGREEAVDLGGLLFGGMGPLWGCGAGVLMEKKVLMRGWRDSGVCLCLSGRERVGAGRRCGRRILRKDVR